MQTLFPAPVPCQCPADRKAAPDWREVARRKRENPKLSLVSLSAELGVSVGTILSELAKVGRDADPRRMVPDETGMVPGGYGTGPMYSPPAATPMPTSPLRDAPVPAPLTPATSDVGMVAPPAPMLPAQSLLVRHRPAKLADVVGQRNVVDALRAFVASPYPAAFTFAGATGTGKTSCAMSLASELGVDVAQGELGGFLEIPSGAQTAEAVRDFLLALAHRPMFGSGWRVGVVSEADVISRQAEAVWLDALESLPGRVVIVMTSNYPEKMSQRLIDRTERHDFRSAAADLSADAQSLAARIWSAETGRTDAPAWESLPGVKDADGQISFRRLVSALAVRVRAVR